MKVLNTMTKVLGIGAKILKPDEVATITKAEGDTPAVKALIAKGFVKVIEEDKPAEEPVAKPEAEEKPEPEAEQVKEEVKEPRRKAEKKPE